jgi:hypothetical protein
MAASVNDICIELVMILTPYFIIYQQTLRASAPYKLYRWFLTCFVWFGVI